MIVKDTYLDDVIRWRSKRKCQFSIYLGIVLIIILTIPYQLAASTIPGVTDEFDLHHGFSEYQKIRPKILISNTFGHHRSKREVKSTQRTTGDGHENKITIELPLDSSLHILDLKLNTDLISNEYFQRTQNEELEPVIHKPQPSEMNLCHYYGTIRNIPNSWAALSTCGHGSLRGMIYDGSEIHYLEPSGILSSIINQTEHESNWETFHFKDIHRIHNFTCHHDENANTGGLENKLIAGLNLHPRIKRDVSSSSYHVPYNSGIKTRYVEMVIVVDKRKFEELGSDLPKVYQRTKDIANIVNALYIPLNIFVALVGVVVWTNKDAINISSKGDDTLSSFLLYRRERLLKDHPNDNAQLLTAIEFEDGVVGKAMQGPICSYKFSGGVTSDFKSVVGIVATTIAHELGHNFGLSHDTEGTCKCDGPESKCIMSASSSSNRTAHWSSCSIESMNFAIEHGMDYCLRNKPRNLFDSPSCGNGFVELDEECDCGHPEHCTNYCCNPHTCKLNSNATCAAGTCCDTNSCQLRVGGTVCRPEQSICDLPEFCTGESEFCPEDVYKQDGLDCETSNGKAYCADGECRTHSDQCQLLWGLSGKNSGDVCYQKNVNGSRYGHCGYDLMTQKFTACGRADIKCGILQCEHHHEKLEFGYEAVAQLASFFVNVGGEIHPCRSVATDFGVDVVDPGLVPNGAICGTNKMCMGQKCVTVESIKGAGICPNDCSGHGICNSKSHCHCDYGHGGDDCDSGGYGGSIDSGPVTNPHGGAAIFARALYVTFLGFIPLIGVISFYLYYAGDNVKRLFKRGRIVGGRRDPSSDKSQQNGTAGGAKRIQGQNDPESTTAPPGATPPNGGAGFDLFGQYKGFSLSPIRNSPPSMPPSSNHTNNNIQMRSHENLDENDELPPLPPLPVTETQILVTNERSNHYQNKTALGRGVSWKEPVASLAPISPDQDDVSSNTSDTPLTTAANTPRSHNFKVRPLSSPDALHDTKLFEPPSIQRKKSSGFGSTSALSRLAAAFPFVRTHSSETTEQSSPKSSTSSLSRQRSFNRDTLEISKPILQNLSQVTLQGNLIPIPAHDVDVVDSPNKTQETHRYQNLSSDEKKSTPFRYANVPEVLPESKSPKSKPVLKTVDRFRNIGNPSNLKVQRAHSMIQPNRNSLAGNSNYNSLRRGRPTAPPPKPPNLTSEVTSKSTPSLVPIQPPPPLITTIPTKPNSILKLTNNNPSPHATLISAVLKAPLAKLDDSDIGSPMSSSSSPSPKNGNSKTENIYDVIDEDGIIPEKVDTLSTGSSDGCSAGLLSEIISEIELRNKDSIYNSVDRRKSRKRDNLRKIGSPVEERSKSPSIDPPKGTRITINPNFKQISPQPTKKLFLNSSPPTFRKPDPPEKPLPPPPNGIIKSEIPVTPHGSMTRELSPNISGKPTCAVNGIPKAPLPVSPPIPVTASSPSYVAKINYFSNLSNSSKNEPTQSMKPISSLSQALRSAAADKDKEPIYAPGQLSTIRPTWSRKSSIGKGEGSIYAKPVATPQIPQLIGTGKRDSIGDSTSRFSRSRSSSIDSSSDEKPEVKNSKIGISSNSGSEDNKEQRSSQGYKSFTPYLSRPLTFSTFRPTTGSISSSTKSSSLGSSSSPSPPLKGVGTESVQLSNGLCSTVKPKLVVSNNSIPNSVVGVGISSPLVGHLRSPSRLVKS